MEKYLPIGNSCKLSKERRQLIKIRCSFRYPYAVFNQNKYGMKPCHQRTGKYRKCNYKFVKHADDFYGTFFHLSQDDFVNINL